MGVPDVDIEILNDQLGIVASSDDGIVGLVISGVATAGLLISTPKQIFTLAAAVALGIDAAYDTTNTTDAYLQISDFYDRAGDGAELWIMIIPKTTTLTTACDKANNVVKKLLNASNGRIKVWGITRTPDVGYTPTFTKGFDDDASAAVVKAQALSEEFAKDNEPIRYLVGARKFTGVSADLFDYNTALTNRGGLVIGSTRSTGEPAVGFTLGQFANRPAQRNIGRVKDGDLGLLQAYFTDGSTVESRKDEWDLIHDKRYIFFRKFKRRSGYYFNDDSAACKKTDDYSSIGRGRVIDKAQRIAYDTYVEELLDDLEIDENGYMDPAVCKSFQTEVEMALNSQMAGNISSGSAECTIDPKQNLLASDSVKISKLGVRPKGYAKTIYVPLGFDNPFINS